MSIDDEGVDEQSKVTVSYCRRCRGNTNHNRIASESEAEDSTGILFKTTFDLLRCRGCDSVSVRKGNFCSDPATVYGGEGWGQSPDDSEGRHDFDYWPAFEKRAAPEWFWEIKEPLLKETLLEIYKALNENLLILAAAGTRIVFDLLANKLLGRDAGRFEQKLDALVAEGHISSRQRTTLDAVVDAGSAAQHRAHKVTPHDLSLILAILEGLIHQTLLAEDKAADLRSRTPQKPKKVETNKDTLT